MPASLRPLSTGELLDKTFSLYRQNFVLFFGIAVLPQAALFLFIILGGLVFGVGASRAPGTSALLGAGIAIGLAYVVGSLIAAAVTQTATTFAVSALYLEQPTGITKAFSAAKRRMLAVIGVTIVFGIAL